MTPITRQDIGMQMFNLFHKLREEFFLESQNFLAYLRHITQSKPKKKKLKVSQMGLIHKNFSWCKKQGRKHALQKKKKPWIIQQGKKII